jgi:DNA-directed RNA polymerase subunit beta
MVSSMSINNKKSLSRVRKSYARLPQVEVPNLIEVQTNSFRRFKEEGLWGLFQEVTPIRDFSGSRLELSFVDYKFEQPDTDEERRQREEECRRRDMTYSWPLFVTVRLSGKEKPEPIEQRLFFGDFPEMTDKGTFIINGAERVVVSQLIRSPGVYFTVEEDVASGRELAYGKLIPDRGAWLEFETSNKDIISVKVDGKRKIPITTLLRALGFGSEEQLFQLFKKEEAEVPEHQYIKTTERG